MPSKGINNIFKPKKNKRKAKKILTYTACAIAISLVVYVGYKKSELLFSNILSSKEIQGKDEVKEEVEEEVKEVDYITLIPKEIKNSEDQIIQTLLDKADENQKVAMILSNKESYPEELLELASKKDEVIDFVADFPNHDEEVSNNISIEKDYKKGDIPLFIQWDERWGYEKYGPDFMAVNGCGPTSLAMVAVGLTGNTDINPKVIADFSEENGYIVEGVGTSWNFMTAAAENFGLQCKELPLSENVIINTLKSGTPIIAIMGPGTFTSVGHYVVLTGVDGNNKIIINDSDSKIRSNQTWDVDIFMKETKNLWSFKAA